MCSPGNGVCVVAVSQWVLLVAGCQAAEGPTDGDARPPREVDGARVEQIHPHSGCLWWSLYWRPLSTC